MQIQDTKKKEALKLFIELVKQNYGAQAALQIVPRALDSDSVEIRKLGCQLLTALVETGNLKQVSWPLVSGVIKKDATAYPETIFDLLRTFIKKKYKMPEVLNLSVLPLVSTSYYLAASVKA